MGLIINSDENDTGSSIVDMMKRCVKIHQGKGLGYAVSTPDELDFCIRLARDTGIVLDPVYTGKALHHFVKNVLPENPEEFRNSTILFWHTGGTLGMYEKVEDLEELLLQEKKHETSSPSVQKLDV